MHKLPPIFMLFAAAPLALAQAAVEAPGPPAQLGLCAACHGEEGQAGSP
jgi:cytochrome c553